MFKRFLPKDVTEFEVEMSALAQLVRENRSDFFHKDFSRNFPVKVLGSGYYGVAFSLLNYPGLVLKVCMSSEDGYPEYIRQVAKLGARRKRWMPEVLAHGGCETEVFWCVLPEYTDPASDTIGNWPDQDSPFYKEGGEAVLTAFGPNNMTARKLTVSRFIDDQFVTGTKHIKIPGTKAERRFARQVRKFFRPMRQAGAGVYMHAHNALKDGDQWIITDPISSWSMQDKRNFADARGV